MKTIYLLISFGRKLGIGWSNLDSKGFFVWYKMKVGNILYSEDDNDENSKLLRFKEDIMVSIWAHMRYLGLVDKTYNCRILGIEVPEDNFLGPVRSYRRNENSNETFPNYLKVRPVSVDNKVISDMISSIKKTGKITRDLPGYSFIENN